MIKKHSSGSCLQRFSPARKACIFHNIGNQLQHACFTAC